MVARAPASHPPAIAPRLRIALTYLWRHGRLPNLADPRLFTELVQHRKLHDRDPRLPAMADKLAVKALVADRLGPEWVVPTLWSGDALPDRPRWPGRFVVKSRHGCNQTIVTTAAALDWPALRTRATRWLDRPYGQWLDEWLYTLVPRGLLVEPFIGLGEALPIDYKLYVFGGQVTHVQVHLDRASAHRWTMFDPAWRPLSASVPAVPRPSALPAMIAAAQELAHDFAFARVDFYQPADRPLFGEICFYPGSGLDPFDPPSLDADLGRLWRDAVTPVPIPSPLTYAPRIAGLLPVTKAMQR